MSSALCEFWSYWILDNINSGLVEFWNRWLVVLVSSGLGKFWFWLQTSDPLSLLACSSYVLWPNWLCIMVLNQSLTAVRVWACSVCLPSALSSCCARRETRASWLKLLTKLALLLMSESISRFVSAATTVWSHSSLKHVIKKMFCFLVPGRSSVLVDVWTRGLGCDLAPGPSITVRRVLFYWPCSFNPPELSSADASTVERLSFGFLQHWETFDVRTDRCCRCSVHEDLSSRSCLCGRSMSLLITLVQTEMLDGSLSSLLQTLKFPPGCENLWLWCNCINPLTFHVAPSSGRSFH